MFTLVLLLVIQIIKNSIHTFRLAADTKISLLKITVIMYNLIEKTGRRETVRKISIKDTVSTVHKFRTVLLGTVFQCIKGIKQRTTHKADFSNIRIITGSCFQLNARIIMGRSSIHIALHKEVAQYIFHTVHRIRGIDRLGTVRVIAILPGTLYTLGEVSSINLGQFPGQGNAITLAKQLESLNRRGKSQFTDISLGSFLIRETIGKDSHATYILEARIADGSLTGYNDLTFFVSSQSLLVKLVNADD